MTDKTFDSIAYFTKLCEENKTCRDNKFVATTCSGPDTVQGVLQKFRKASNFIMVSDTVDSNTHSAGEGFFERNVYTVWILAAYKHDDMEDREKKLNLCRYIFRQFISRILHDKYREAFDGQLEFLDLRQIYSSELGRYSLNGVTGLYFMLNSDEPIDVQYDESLWQTSQQ